MALRLAIRELRPGVWEAGSLLGQQARLSMDVDDVRGVLSLSFAFADAELPSLHLGID